MYILGPCLGAMLCTTVQVAEGRRGEERRTRQVSTSIFAFHTIFRHTPRRPMIQSRVIILQFRRRFAPGVYRLEAHKYICRMLSREDIPADQKFYDRQLAAATDLSRIT